MAKKKNNHDFDPAYFDKEEAQWAVEDEFGE